MFDRKLNIFLIIFFVLFVAISFFAFTNTRVPFFTQAVPQEVDISKSFLIASRLEAEANGLESITINAFVRNAQGVSIANKTVSISSTLGLVDKPSSVTDKYGKATFIVKSSESGNATIQANIEGHSLDKTLQIRFTE